jgi:hypothetical protein
MSRTIGIWFVAMMLLGFACIYAGDATKGSNLEWFAPASSEMRAQLSPLMAGADAIDIAHCLDALEQRAHDINDRAYALRVHALAASNNADGCASDADDHRQT